MPLIAPNITIWSVAQDGNLEGLQRFVAQGIPLDSRDRGGLTALHVAAKAGHLEVVQWLVEHGADLHACTFRNPGDAGSHTPLHLAVGAGRLEVARFLIERGAKVNAKMSDGATSLMLAAESGRTDLLMLLLEHGADISLHSQIGQTAFSIAACSERWALAEVLVQKGADVNDRSQGNNGTVLMSMAVLKDVVGVQFLLSHGADVHLRDDLGQTALHLAVIGATARIREWTHDEKGNSYKEDDPAAAIRVIRVLLSAGALTTVPDADGMTPVSRARKLKLTNVVELLEGPPSPA